MADLNCSGLDDLMLSMQELAEIPDEVQDEMLNAQADVVVLAQKQQGAVYRVEDTGMTLRSIKKGRIKLYKGQRVIYVTPSGTRKRGKKRIRNAEVAFINEYGKRGQKARPFIREGNERSAAEATQAALQVYDRWLKSKNL